MISIDTDLLRCFVAIAETGGFTAAGDRLGLTQSGVSVRMRRLEDRLQVQLLARTSRSVALTADGELLLGYARRMLDLNDEVVRRFTLPAATGHLHAGVADYVVPNRLQGLLARFRKHYPRVSLEITVGLGMDLVPRLEKGDLDVVVAAATETSVPSRPLYREPLVWCAPDGWSLCAEEPIPLACLPIPCSQRRAGVAALEQAGYLWQASYTSTSVAGVQAAVRAGLGIAVLPDSAVDGDMRRLTPKDGFPALPETEIVAFLRQPESEPAKAFVCFFEDEVPCAKPRSDEAARVPDHAP